MRILVLVCLMAGAVAIPIAGVDHSGILAQSQPYHFFGNTTASGAGASGSPPLPFAWKSCGKPGDPATVTAMDITPTPIAISKTVDTDVTITMAAGMSVDITAGTSFSLLIKKRVPFTSTFEKIPCVDQMGSCDFPDLCGSLQNMMPTCNDWFTQHKISCHCPILAQTFIAPPSAFKIPPVGNMLPSWLADGDFQVTVTALDGKGAEIGCLYMQMSLKLKP